MVMICSSCQSTKFYEDSQGSMCCEICGIQSQDYLPESNDLFDDEREMEKVHWISKKKAYTTKKAKKKYNLYDFLSAYQYCLKMLVLSLPVKDEKLVRYVQSLWVSYNLMKVLFFL